MMSNVPVVAASVLLNNRSSLPNSQKSFDTFHSEETLAARAQLVELYEIAVHPPEFKPFGVSQRMWQLVVIGFTAFCMIVVITAVLLHKFGTI
jgi:hypothetical protein